MVGRATDHRNMDLARLHRDVIAGRSNGMILWQPRIGCWYDDRVHNHVAFPEPYTGLDLPGLYRALGCSNRNYVFNECIVKVDDPRVVRTSRKISELETEHIVDTPVGRIRSIQSGNTSNIGTFPKKWWAESEEDCEVLAWAEERCSWRWDQARYLALQETWGDLGLPTVYLPRVNVQHLYIDVMGVEQGTYALHDYPKTMERYFEILSESHERLIDVINACPVDVINFGDNVHSGMLPPELFRRYVLPEYRKRNERLHKAGKFTSSHWDGDTRPLLPYARECGFDGIEAVTPKPQGDVTLAEVKAAFGDDLFLLDGIAAVLFEERFPIEELERQAKEAIERFAPRLILGISDEISSMGTLDRIRYVGEIVDDYNARRMEEHRTCCPGNG